LKRSVKSSTLAGRIILAKSLIVVLSAGTSKATDEPGNIGLAKRTRLRHTYLTTENLARQSPNQDSEYLAQRRKACPERRRRSRKELNFRTWRSWRLGASKSPF